MIKKLHSLKPCKKCGRVRSRSKNGRTTCRSCISERLKEKYRKFILSVLVEQKKYRESHKSDISKRNRAYREKNVESIRNYQKVWRKENKHPDYQIWTNIKYRCHNPNSDKYFNYGGRGIRVCERWKNSFIDFIEDMGLRPEPKSKYSIERLDVNGNYEPDNCVWATAKEQQNNKRNNIKYRTAVSSDNFLGYKGKLISLREFSDITGLLLIICKYRSAQHPDCTDWILHDDYDNRYYEYRSHKYNISELSLISGIHYSKIRSRLVRDGWSVERALMEN